MCKKVKDLEKSAAARD